MTDKKYGEITLPPREALLRDLLLDCRKQLDGHTSLGMWITGGWVRDHLLGIPCHDVDIALSSMTGVQFGDALTAFLEKHGGPYYERAAQLGLPKKDFTGFNTTKKNLDKSKKLETAVGRLFDLDIDLVNLRKEVYEEDSRTPEMEFGTPEEDAFRRDATVNSMFYDLVNEKVVDLTGRGLEDLAAGIMRTPLEPRQTFLDDPLRVLRLVRIGSKLGYQIERGVLESMEQEEIHRALNSKVSRDRVNIEVFKMMNGNNTHGAFEVLYNTGLYETVFLDLDSGIRSSVSELVQSRPGKPWPSPWMEAVRTVPFIEGSQFTALKKLVQTSETREELWTMIAYCPLAKLPSKERKNTVVQISSALKLTKNLTKLVDSALTNFDDWTRFVKEVTEAKDTPSRGSLGTKIRKMGASWKMQLIFSAMGEIVYTPQGEAEEQAAIQAILSRYEVFLEVVKKLSLENVVSTRPVIDGTRAMKLLGVKGGPWLSGLLEEMVLWQLDHEEAGVDEAEAWLRDNREALGVPPPKKLLH